MSPTSGRLAIITGSRTGIGLRVAEHLLGKGYRVALNGRSKSGVNSEIVSRAIETGTARYYPINLTEPLAADQLVHQVVSEQGHPSILVNNAASRPHQAFDQIQSADWAEVLQLGLWVPFRLTQLVLPQMIKGGSGVIVNVSGVDGIVGKSHRAHGVVAKAGIHGLTVAISAEFARAGVTAVTIAPGTVDTEKPASRYPDFNRADHAAKADIGRLINVHEVASAICAAIDIPALSGSVIRVDGGGRGR